MMWQPPAPCCNWPFRNATQEHSSLPRPHLVQVRLTYAVVPLAQIVAGMGLRAAATASPLAEAAAAAA